MATTLGLLKKYQIATAERRDMVLCLRHNEEHGGEVFMLLSLDNPDRSTRDGQKAVSKTVAPFGAAC